MNGWTDYLSSLPVARGQRAEVLATSELRRIRDAERYVWQDEPRLAELIARRTEQLRAPGGTQTLRPVQAVVLSTLAATGRGCFAPVRTGGGKTLISLLAAEVLDAKRPLLLVPASLRDKTRREAHALARHWRIRPIRIISYESLGKLSHEHALEKFEPDLVICDESHYLKNTKAGCTRRVRRYVQAKREAPVPVLCMSGSITSRTLRDYWHQLRWCLGDAMPLPREPEELQQWMWALDEKVPDGMRWSPGALMELSPEPTLIPGHHCPLCECGVTYVGLTQVRCIGEGCENRDPELDADPLAVARARYGRRLMSTPGVVGSGGDMPQAGLICRIEQHDPSQAVREAVERMRATWETPCGLPFETAMDLWRHERELSCGLYYKIKNVAGFEQCLRKHLNAAGSSYLLKRLLKDAVLPTENELERAVASLKEGVDTTSSVNCEFAMASIWKSLKGCSHFTTANAICAGVFEDSEAKRRGVVETVSALITATQLAKYEDYSAILATVRSECWEILLRGWPELLSICKEVIQASRPPFEWLTARKAWSAFCRETLSRSRTLDTPLAVAKAIHDGRLDDGGLLAAWQAVEPSFDPVTEAVWICDEPVLRAAAWLERNPGGLCWVHHGAFGRRLSQVTGIPYFSQLGRAPSGVAIDEHPVARSAIASLSSCSRGFNLQARWQNYITTCPTKNLPCEQTISRTHRDGQEHDDVEVIFTQSLEGDRKALDQARADALYVESTTLQPQRLTVATWLE